MTRGVLSSRLASPRSAPTNSSDPPFAGTRGRFCFPSISLIQNRHRSLGPATGMLGRFLGAFAVFLSTVESPPHSLSGTESETRGYTRAGRACERIVRLAFLLSTSLNETNFRPILKSPASLALAASLRIAPLFQPSPSFFLLPLSLISSARVIAACCNFRFLFRPWRSRSPDLMLPNSHSALSLRWNTLIGRNLCNRPGAWLTRPH